MHIPLFSGYFGSQKINTRMKYNEKQYSSIQCRTIHDRIQFQIPQYTARGQFTLYGPFYNDHDDAIKRKHFLRYWPFVWAIHRSPVNSPHKGQWRGALMYSLICVWINGWVNNREAGDLRRYPAHCDVIVIFLVLFQSNLLDIYSYQKLKQIGVQNYKIFILMRLIAYS